MFPKIFIDKYDDDARFLSAGAVLLLILVGTADERLPSKEFAFTAPVEASLMEGVDAAEPAVSGVSCGLGEPNGVVAAEENAEIVPPASAEEALEAVVAAVAVDSGRCRDLKSAENRFD